jgi:hypothetical protein
MKHAIALPLLVAFGLVVDACSAGSTDTGVASLDTDTGDIQT